MKKIGVVGAGSWGTALANLLAHSGASEEVILWGRHAAQMEALCQTRENAVYLPGIHLPPNVVPTGDLAALADAEMILIVTPSKGMREIAQQLALVHPRGILVSCTKGIEQGSGLRMSEIIHEILPENPITVLSGPSHAEEVSRGIPAALVLGSQDEAIATTLQLAINSQTFRVYTSTDVAGIELGGALKNIFAIAAGVSEW